MAAANKRPHDNLVALHYQEAGSCVVKGQSLLTTNPIDEWALRKILTAKRIIADLVEYAECNDPRNPLIEDAKEFLSGVNNGSR